ncbi:hypothetical protein CYMTET_42317 [Cymbomonas tetramitiformis]|uniref:Uncharacterized protein n=1 Tax=Cymbomonas tetramitiformis TaxID=36881 RepID=A0AAE0F1S7_9CHLO|nr:hypothetical protein CYMTET_42317 [Cymbomonas tetramitiformis]
MLAQHPKNNCTPLLLAVKGMHESIVLKLLAVGVDLKLPPLNAEHEDGYRPEMNLLHLAAEKGSDTIVRAVLAAGFQVHAKDQLGHTAFHYAALNDHPHVLRVLHSFGADPNTPSRDGCHALHMASFKGHVETVKVLLELECHINTRGGAPGCTPLHLAVQEGKEEVAGLLLEAGAAVDAGDIDRCTPLHWAAEKGHIGTVQRLFEHNADVNATDEVFPRTAPPAPLLPRAAGNRGGDDTCSALAGSRGGDGHLLHLAVQYMHGGGTMLLKNGANKNALIKWGHTALHWAAMLGHEAVVSALIEAGANTHIRNRLGKTARDVACDNQRIHVETYLWTANRQHPNMLGFHTIRPSIGELPETPVSVHIYR